MKDKIEEILGRHERDDVFGITQELLHLIQEERKDAVEGFVNYAVVEAKKHQGNMFDGFMFDKAKEYLESEK